MKTKFYYSTEEDSKAAYDRLLKDIPKFFADGNGLTFYSSIWHSKIVDDLWCIHVHLSLDILKKFEKDFAQDRVSILDHSLKHCEKKYKENLALAQNVLREAKFLFRYHGRYKFLFCPCWNPDKGYHLHPYLPLQKAVAKLQRQIRLQNKFIAAIRKFENASPR